MLKMMSGNKFFTVFLLSAITLMISVAFIFWGIGPKDSQSVIFAARVGDEKILLDEFWRVYDNEYKKLREQYPDQKEIEEKNLKERVLGTMVDRKVLLLAAKKAGITVTENELKETIINTPYFQRNGVFDPNVYKRALKLSRITPRAYERGLRNDLIISRMSNLVGETAELSPEELKILKSIKGGNGDQLNKIFLSTKKNQSIQVFIESIKRQMDIKINRDIIS
ncbi:MAG TPA: hypothetical protein ENG83_11735 [Nitrospirae bacterium]|nr:peptidyl-prolyl cis-trans isomerase D [bacterium BMS3Abin06]HDH12845.1 hypothetical protein [Nitrospirota bacterium]HDZ01622.1 hypothetical protein [Nitrospirota bacterium]